MINAMIERVTAWDIVFFSTIFKQRELPVVTRCMRAVSASADGWLYPPAAAALAMAAPETAMPLLAALAIAFAVERPAYMLLKRKVRRDRPFQALRGVRSRVAPSDQFSFPSGHTAAACIMAIMTAYFFPVAAVPVYLWACCVGLSRVYLGVHYPSDILAGMLLGSLCAASGISLVS